MRIESQQEMHLSYAHSGAMIASMQKPKYAAIITRLVKATGKKPIDVSREAGVEQSTLSRLMAGKIKNPSYDKLSALAKYFGVSVDQLLGKEHLSSDSLVTLEPSHLKLGKNIPFVGGVVASALGALSGDRTNPALEAAEVDHGGEALPFEVEVPYFREVELSAGDGRTEVIENHGVRMRLPRHVLEEAGVGLSDAACARLRGESMEPVIKDGAIIGVDCSHTSIDDGEVYAFDHDGMLRVKYLYRMPMNRIRVSSQNSDVYPDEYITPEEMQFVRIIGRVFWWQTIRPKPRH